MIAFDLKFFKASDQHPEFDQYHEKNARRVILSDKKYFNLDFLLVIIANQEL